ncbi:unnamed protein product [Brassica oleracea]
MTMWVLLNQTKIVVTSRFYVRTVCDVFFFKLKNEPLIFVTAIPHHLTQIICFRIEPNTITQSGINFQNLGNAPSWFNQISDKSSTKNTLLFIHEKSYNLSES